MSTRLTLADVKSTISRVVHTRNTDTRIADYVNEAQRRLMDRGKWVGTVVRYKCCVNAGALTWPRQIETIEAYAVCETPGIIRNGWYEFLANGPGQLDKDNCWRYRMLDRGTACAFDDVVGTGKKIKVYADVSEAAGAQILLQYYKGDGNWVRTNPSGSYIDGEYVDLNDATPQLTSNTVMANGLVAVKKPVTNGVIRLYEYDPTTLAEKPLAVYEPDETNPTYRRSFIPGLENLGRCADSTSDCENKTITVVAKLRHIDVSADGDWLILQNLPALKLAVMAIIKEEQNKWDEAIRYMEGTRNPQTGRMENGAIPLLQAELANYHGSGMVHAIKFEDGDIWAGNVDNII